MYKVANYEEFYMPTDSKNRELVNANYVKVPAKPKGNGLEELLRRKDGLKVFAIWILLLESTTAQKKGTRGILNNHKDEPASIKEIAKGVLLSKQVKFVKYAIGVLVDLRWIIDDGVRSESVQGTLFVPPKSSEEESNKEKSKVEKQFTPPTLEQLNLYIQEKELGVDAKRFLDWYTESEWLDNKEKPVKNWKLKLLSWDRNSTDNGKVKPKAELKSPGPKRVNGLTHQERYEAEVKKQQENGTFKFGQPIKV